MCQLFEHIALNNILIIGRNIILNINNSINADNIIWIDIFIHAYIGVFDKYLIFC